MAPSGLKAVVRKSECGAGGSECGAGRGQESGWVWVWGGRAQLGGPGRGAPGGVSPSGRIRSQSEQRAPPRLPVTHQEGEEAVCPTPKGCPLP